MGNRKKKKPIQNRPSVSRQNQKPESEEIVGESADDELETSDDVEIIVAESSKKKKKSINYDMSEEKVPFGTRFKIFFTKILRKLKKMLKNMKSELSKVTWYGRKQTFSSTVIVLIVIGVAALAIAGLDFGFSKSIEGLAEGVYQFTRWVSKR